MHATKSSIGNFRHTSKLAVMAIMIEDYVKSRSSLQEISKNVAKNVLHEKVQVQPGDSRAYEKLINSTINLIAGVKKELSNAAPTAVGVLDAADAKVKAVQEKQGKGASISGAEIEEINAIGDVIDSFKDGLIYAIKEKRKNPDIKSSNVVNGFSLSSGAAGAEDLKKMYASSVQKIAEEIISLDPEITKKFVNVPQQKTQQTVAAAQKQDEQEAKDESKIDKELLKKAMNSKEFKEAFNTHTKSLGFSISLDDFKAMVNQKIIDGNIGQKFIEDFAFGPGKELMDKIAKGPRSRQNIAGRKVAGSKTALPSDVKAGPGVEVQRIISLESLQRRLRQHKKLAMESKLRMIISE